MLRLAIKRISACACLAALLFPLVVSAADPTQNATAIPPSGMGGKHASPLTLDHALDIALGANPGLAKSKARAMALAEVPPQVGTLPEPTLSLNALNLPTDTFSLSQEAMTQMQLGIGFVLPYPGKLDLRERQADLEARAAEFDADEMRLVLIRNVHAVWWNLFFLDRATTVVRQNQNLLREFVKIAETKYKTGLGVQSDVLLAQVELSRLLDTEIVLKASRRGQTAAMNALLGRSTAIEVVLPGHFDESLPPPPGVASLRNIALDARPALSAQRAALEAARTRVMLGEKDYYPDFKMGAAYGFRGGNNPDGRSRANMSSFTISMNLPIFSGTKQDHALSQTRADVLKEEHGLQDRVAQMDTEIEQALSDYLASREQAALFKTGIIPQANQTVSSMLAAYQVGKVDFLNLIRAQITLYNYETQYWKVLSSGWQAWARLEAAVGMPISRQGREDTAVQTDKEKVHENE